MCSIIFSRAVCLSLSLLGRAAEVYVAMKDACMNILVGDGTCVRLLPVGGVGLGEHFEYYRVRVTLSRIDYAGW